MACIVLWFNPFTWLYKKSLQQNLEFIADQQAQYVSPCERSYQTVLLKASVSNHDLVFTNNFYTSLIKKRIVMLHKSKSRSSKQLKLLIVLPLLGLFIMSFNTKDIYIEAPSEKTNIMENMIKESEVVEIIFTKNTSDADLATIKSDLEKKGFAFEYSGVKRNKDGEITAISVEFSNGKSSSKHKIKGDKPIKSFKFTGTEKSMDINGMEDGNTFTYSSNNGLATLPFPLTLDTEMITPFSPPSVAAFCKTSTRSCCKIPPIFFCRCVSSMLLKIQRVFSINVAKVIYI